MIRKLSKAKEVADPGSATIEPGLKVSVVGTSLVAESKNSKWEVAFLPRPGIREALATLVATSNVAVFNHRKK